MRKTLHTALALTVWLALLQPVRGQRFDPAELERLSKQGQTLSVEVTQAFPLPEQRVVGDTGVNVLIDLAHQATFQAMWSLPGELRRHGFRAVGSQATLDTVLQPGSLCRIRIAVGKRRPFAWWRAPKWNAVVTFQTQPNAPAYLPEEIAALKKFVDAGGGLVIACGDTRNADTVKAWSLNRLLAAFDAQLLTDVDQVDGYRVTPLRVGRQWEVVRRAERGGVAVARRRFGRGRVVVYCSSRLLFWDKRAEPDSPRSRAQRGRSLAEQLQWASAGSPPAGGTRRLPREAGGGGPIYPELEEVVAGVVVYYAKNQLPELLKAVREDMPKVAERVQQWLPSPKPDEPMYLIVSAGGGGGWAVNAYRPKETGVISLSPRGLLSVFAHELAHTMSGPVNDAGRTAANWPQGNQGESHAGWFQGKINALFDPSLRQKANRDCNRLFRFDPTGRELDLAMPPAELRRKWGKGKEWVKMWWVWQKLDDRYGTTWYPRWRWVQYTRWKDDPNRQLSWDETVEDMSIAVGEDLFPFFRKIGTSLKRERFPEAEFLGQRIVLPVAPLEVSPAGPVRLDPIGDYKQPLKPRPDTGAARRHRSLRP